jgi:hypothetical protein
VVWVSGWKEVQHDQHIRVEIIGREEKGREEESARRGGKRSQREGEGRGVSETGREEESARRGGLWHTTHIVKG